jgi:hypothetical protein
VKRSRQARKKKEHALRISDLLAACALFVSILSAVYTHHDAQDALRIAQSADAGRAPFLDLRNCAYGFKDPPESTLIAKGARGNNPNRSDTVQSIFHGYNKQEYTSCDRVNHGEAAATNVTYSITYFFASWNQDSLVPSNLGKVQTATYRISAIEPHAVVRIAIYDGDRYYGMDVQYPRRVFYSTRTDSTEVREHELAINGSAILSTLCPVGEQTIRIHACGPIDPNMWLDVKHHVFHRP